MTYDEFIESFNTKFYAATTVESLGWEESEICSFLNSAQMQLLKQLSSAEAFADIPELIVKIEGNKFDGDPSNAIVTINKPVDYYDFIAGSAAFTRVYDNTNEQVIAPLSPVSLDTIYLFMASNENRTLFLTPKLTIKEDENFLIVLDSYTNKDEPVKVIIYYLKFPEKFDSTPDTPQITDIGGKWHDDIVNLAVGIAVNTMIKVPQSSQ